MLKEALRRVLWLAPTLVVISGLAFWALTSSVAPSRTERLPRFFNPSPEDVRTLVRRAADRVGHDGPNPARAKEQLIAIGAAGLPHLVPYLDALDPVGRGRVALALAPIAERMGLSRAKDLDAPHEAVLFWNRYWQDHAIDFRPAVVERAVRRYARRPSSLRRSEVVHYDTYALGAIIEQLELAGSEGDVQRVERLSTLAARVTDRPWTLEGGAAREAARRIANRWSHWWIENAHRFSTYSGTRRAAAMVRETRYGRWAADVARGRLGTLRDGRSVLSVLADRGTTTLWLLLAALLGGIPLGIAVGAASLQNRRADTITTIFSVIVVALPMALVASFAHHLTEARLMGGMGLMVITSAALVSRYQRSQQRLELEQPHATAHLAFGASWARLIFRQLRHSTSAVLALVATQIPWLVTAAFVVEHALQLPGLGPMTVDAIEQRDIAWLMAVCIALTLTVGIAQIATDGLAATLDRRVRDEPASSARFIG